MTIERQVLRVIEKYPDVEVHVSKIKVEGKSFVEIREYIPSLKGYGKGVTLPTDLLYDLNEALGDFEDDS